jgi:ornithine carbamoyltransferase
MAVNMKGKSLASLYDLTREEIEQVLKTSELLKLQNFRGEAHPLLEGKTLAMVFEKASTRTRVSFEVGMWQLGGYALYLSAGDLQLGRGETIGDTAQVLSRYVDGIMARVFSHQTILDLVQYARVPVINGLSDYSHPCQGLADLFTMYEKKGRLEGLRVAYVGDGNNVAHSLLYGCSKTGAHIKIGTPPGYEPKAEVVSKAVEEGRKNGSTVEVTNDPQKAVRDADVVYTDVWTSMGQEAEQAERDKAFAGYQVNAELMRRAKPTTVVMHCLPAHRGSEITDEVMDGPQSIVFQQAENRLHSQRALLEVVLSKGK